MAQVDNSYYSHSILQLYELLSEAIVDMFNASDGKHHDLFLEKQNDVNIIREIIEKKKEAEMINKFKIV